MVAASHQWRDVRCIDNEIPGEPEASSLRSISVAPARLGQVVEDAGADVAAADDGDMDVLLRRSRSRCAWLWSRVRWAARAAFAAGYQARASPYMTPEPI